METKKQKDIISSKIRTLIESGMSAEEVAKTLQEEERRKQEIKMEGDEKEVFPEEIRIVAQALAFRVATPGDIAEIWSVLSASYKPEVTGNESFRSGEVVSLQSIHQIFDDPSYHWLLVESPNGHGFIEDGSILGVCCYSLDGISRKNGEANHFYQHELMSTQ